MKGNPIYAFPKGMRFEDAVTEENRVTERILPEYLLIQGLFGWVRAKLVEQTVSTGKADDGGNIWDLHYCPERGCWCCDFGMNKKVMKP